MTLVKIVNKKISLISKATKLLWESSPQNFFVLCILSIAMSLPEVAGLWVWKEILNFISLSLTGSEPMIEQICFYIFLHLCLKIIASLLNKLNTYNSNILKIMVDKEINKKYFNVVNGLLPQDIEVAEIRDKLEMIERDAGERTLGILMKMVELFQSISLLIFTSSVLAVIDFKIILVVLLSIIPISIAYKRTYKDIFIVYSERLEKLRYVKALRDTVHQNGFVMENMIYKVINYVETKSEELINEIIKSEKKLKKRVFIREALVENISMMLAYVVKLMLIILGISNNNNLGSIVMSISAFDKINNSILNVSMISNSLYDDGLYLKAINDLEEYAKKNSSNESRKQIINEVNKISFKNVFFRYQNSKSYSLKNISLNFEKGKSYAIVGKNGSGKSTLVKLILGMYSPLNGEITIDGISMCDYNRYSLYDMSSVLFQEFMKYPLSFYENIRFKDRDKDEDILFNKTCELVKLNDLIQELPEKEDQLLTKGWKDSIDLSGGQWQKVAIARFFAKDGLLRILDEPGASLDAKSESEILKNIIITSFQYL
ncbi:ABC transporter ATP-binding protein [Peptoniphilus lacrimalis]|uniref:ATP-binding cassette domain-containing protein n=1 Tax=Peptoniphilus lacrimalis TaxID=33031 RepID=UPI00254BD7D8|nr:ABC transporter ATP-binding protein [Peptoniphilus lacrimalis]MDK7722880.1 ABC transporter ATP-binding protein [Peptoniphilus lacrimalis]MDK7732482.1 ABC transporter ATP-binding protein [Peptoniphilus lacrimalis]